MFTKTLRWAVITGFAIFTSACATEYTYIPPDTAEGRGCTSQCQSAKNLCRTTQLQLSSEAQKLCKREAAEKKNVCEHQAQVEYNACLKFARTYSDRASCYQETCLETGCYNSADFGFCEKEFRGCYQNCGGRIGKMK